MSINDQARKNHEELFPGRVSTLTITDPDLIEIFDNFAFDEILRHGEFGRAHTAYGAARCHYCLSCR